jgi:hypothetical protein
LGLLGEAEAVLVLFDQALTQRRRFDRRWCIDHRG